MGGRTTPTDAAPDDRNGACVLISSAGRHATAWNAGRSAFRFTPPCQAGQAAKLLADTVQLAAGFDHAGLRIRVSRRLVAALEKFRRVLVDVDVLRGKQRRGEAGQPHRPQRGLRADTPRPRADGRQQPELGTIRQQEDGCGGTLVCMP